MKSPFLHFIIALAICIVAVTGYGLLYAIISAKSTSVASLQNEIDIKTESASRTASTRTALAEISGDGNAIQNYFVPKTGVVAFINMLEEQGKKQGTAVSILSVSTGSSKTQPTLVLSLTIHGTFDAVMRTVGVIEYDPYDIAVTQLSLGHDAKNSWNATLGLVVGSVDSQVATSTP